MRGNKNELSKNVRELDRLHYCILNGNIAYFYVNYVCTFLPYQLLLSSKSGENRRTRQEISLASIQRAFIFLCRLSQHS
jgi:hypothetical protein